jgi:hypothetical protein
MISEDDSREEQNLRRKFQEKILRENSICASIRMISISLNEIMRYNTEAT